VEVLTGFGFQVPVIGGLLVELFGNTTGVALRHMGGIGTNVGRTGGSITTLIVAGSAH